jgi:hypothetical protein
MYRVEFILSFIWAGTAKAEKTTLERKRVRKGAVETGRGRRHRCPERDESDTPCARTAKSTLTWSGSLLHEAIVKKVVAEDHRDVLSKIDKLFKTWWDDPKTLRKEGFAPGLITHISPNTLKLNITKLERGSQIDIE